MTDADILRIATATESGGAVGDGPREHFFTDEALVDFARRLLAGPAQLEGRSVALPCPTGGVGRIKGPTLGDAIDAAIDAGRKDGSI